MKLISAFKAFFRELKQTKEEIPSLKQAPIHLQLLSMLQKQGRLIDFLKEDLSAYTDAQIGSAVRKIHADCSKSLEEWVTLRPVLGEQEGQQITLAQGYDEGTIKIMGNVKGKPPYRGVVRHRGWKAHKLTLPQKIGEHQSEIVMPAEVEIQG